MSRMSVATIDKPEFINLKPLDINPLMSACEIKVLYLGENRNHSFISKEVATEMSKTLRGAPIVGWYREDKQDFGDHGDRMTIDGSGIKFECLTKPYGFVSPDAKVWFQTFEDTDDFGNTVIREYLMTTGYLWTGQFEEAQMAIDSGKPHSMELDEDTLEGNWSTNLKSNMEFFIINDAIFSKLCMLGDDVEPCFEGSSVTAPEISKTFTADDEFKHSLYTMMQQLKFALEGGQSMANINGDVPAVEPTSTEFSTTQDNLAQPTTVENQNFTKEASEEKEKENKEDYACADDEDKKKKDYKKEEDNKEEKDSSNDSAKEDEEDEEDKNKKGEYALLLEKFSALESRYNQLETEYNQLVEFKNNIENEKKDALINSFYMLSDEDKKDVIENKAKYSLDEIEAKLSVICVRNKVNFDLDTTDKNNNTVEEKPATTFNLEDSSSNVPAWVTALRNTQNSRNI